MSTHLNSRTTLWRTHHIVLASVLAIVSSACSESAPSDFETGDLRGSLENAGEDAATNDPMTGDGGMLEGQGMDPGFVPEEEPTADPDAGAPAPAAEDGGVPQEPSSGDPDASIEEPPPVEPDAGTGEGEPTGTEPEPQGAVLSFETVTEVAPTGLVASASGGAASPFFGYPVVVQGDRMLVGAWGDAEQAPEQGAAFLFERVNGTWVQDAKLMASDANVEPLGGSWGASFGWVVAMDGDTLAISAGWDDDDDGTADVGAVYVYELTAGSWIETKLRAPEPMEWAAFGDGLTLSGDWLFVRGHDMTRGYDYHTVYVYHRGVNGWELTQEIDSPQGDDQRSFGTSMVAGGTKLFVSAERSTDGGWSWPTYEYSVYAYELVNGTWTLDEQLRASDDMPGNTFGTLAFDGQTLVVGAPYLSDDFKYQGAAYVFEEQAGTWTEVLAFREETPRKAYLGYVVSVDGPTLAIGTMMQAMDDSVYVFQRSSDTNTWSLSQTVSVAPVLTAAQTPKYRSLCVSNDELYFGLDEGTSNGNAWGAVYSLSGGSVQ